MNAHENATGLAMVKAGFAADDPSDERRVLHFRVGFESAEGAAAALRAIGVYNDFDGEKVAAAVERLSLVGRSIEVGREGSPVVYIGPFYGEDTEGDRVIDAMLEVHADEIDRQGKYVRIWWD